MSKDDSGENDDNSYDGGFSLLWWQTFCNSIKFLLEKANKLVYSFMGFMRSEASPWIPGSEYLLRKLHWRNLYHHQTSPGVITVS